MSERWLPVVGYEGSYEVSDQGRVRSLDRTITRSDGRPLRLKGTLLAPHPHHKTGRLQVSLRLPGRAKEARHPHVLCLAAFKGPAPTGTEGCHNDGDISNNRLTNLRWDTHKGNCADRVLHGTQTKGETSGRAKLTEPEVVVILKRISTGEAYDSISDDFDVGITQIRRIGRRENWKHVA